MRPGYQPPKIERPAKKEGGIHFKSNVSGLYSDDEAWRRFVVKGVDAPAPAPSRANRAALQSRALSKRAVRATKLRGALKGTRKGERKPKRQTKSASPLRQKKKHTFKSK